jgi:uncharacterized glyoxalase superfamily protein PhnB
MKPTPKGWPRLSAAVFYEDAPRAIDWLCRAFGFEVQLRVDGEGGRVAHSQLTVGDDASGVGLVMVASLNRDLGRPGDGLRASPREVAGKVTTSLMLYVDDVDAHADRARAAGATIAVPPTTTDYGADYWADRGYEAVDPEGHRWWFTQRIRG